MEMFVGIDDVDVVLQCLMVGIYVTLSMYCHMIVLLVACYI